VLLSLVIMELFTDSLFSTSAFPWWRLKDILSTSVTVWYFLVSLDVDMTHSFVRKGMDRLIHR
jgi:hypothetical protein